MSEQKTYSYWVVEVDHQTGYAAIDYDATEFWVSRIFSPESNVMTFTPNEEHGFDDRETIEINHDDLDNEYDRGAEILVKALAKGQK